MFRLHIFIDFGFVERGTVNEKSQSMNNSKGIHAEHMAPSHLQTSKHAARAPRNTNVEMLRIFAMLCITFNHFTWPTQEIVGSEHLLQHLPISTALSLISNLGGIGDCLFFFISVWYICEETANYKRQFKRVWILERELLFWSLLLLACNLLSQEFGFQEAYSRKNSSNILFTDSSQHFPPTGGSRHTTCCFCS